jgi:UDP-N-acetylmuramate--alanine ligase
MKFNELNTIYFLGIGGIGMSALARYFKVQGVDIHGYDRTPSQLSRELEAEGMKIHYQENPAMIPEQTDLVIYTPAIPQNNAEWIYIQEKKFQVLKRSAVLGKLTTGKFTIAVAGTHGKTSITTTIAHLLQQLEIPFSALIGGIGKNFNSNMITHKDARYMLVEADEFDKSFLQLNPDIAIISSMDADHLDIYQNHQYMQETFDQFAQNIKANGLLISRYGLPIITDKQNLTYGIDDRADLSAMNIHVHQGRFCFDLLMNNNRISQVIMGVPGRHNIENALAALSVISAINLDMMKASKALTTYQGVNRRFDIRINNKEVTYIDDYAHHPEELKACINATRELFPGRHITGIFQPHLFSRTRDLMQEFAESLALLDELVLLPIYPAREEPIPGITSDALFEKIKLDKKHFLDKTAMLEWLDNNKPDILLTLGAGDIDRLVEPIEKVFSK